MATRHTGIAGGTGHSSTRSDQSVLVSAARELFDACRNGDVNKVNCFSVCGKRFVKYYFTRQEQLTIFFHNCLI